MVAVIYCDCDRDQDVLHVRYAISSIVSYMMEQEEKQKQNRGRREGRAEAEVKVIRMQPLSKPSGGEDAGFCSPASGAGAPSPSPAFAHTHWWVRETLTLACTQNLGGCKHVAVRQWQCSPPMAPGRDG